jgi:hypothetical protein
MKVPEREYITTTFNMFKEKTNTENMTEEQKAGC